MVVAAVLVIGGIIATVATAGPGALPTAWPLVGLGYTAWWLFWYPRVCVSADGVTLVNPLRRICVPWAALIQVDTKYALTLVTARRSYRAWAAPAPGVIGTHAGKPEHLMNLPETSYGPLRSVRPGDLSNSDSGYAAFLVRSQWERLRDSGAIEPDGEGAQPVVMSINWGQLAGAAVLVIVGFLADAG